jgi:MFS family permease
MILYNQYNRFWRLRKASMKLGGLWRDRDFMPLWTGETVSLFGSQITMLALPLTAAVLLNATPAQLGLLSAAAFAPFLLLSLVAGIWLDGRRKRPVMMAANLGRGALLLLVVVLALSGQLKIQHLYVSAFLVGSLSILFELAYQSYLPALLERKLLPDGNSKLFASAAVADVGGPGIAGWLIEALSAPLALLADGVSFIVAGFTLLFIRKPEPTPARSRIGRPLFGDIASGLRLLVRNPYLRIFAAEAATYNLFNQAFLTLFVVYATRDLGFSPGMLGLLFAIGSVGSLVGSMITVPAARRIGMGRAIILGTVLGCSAPLLIPLASGPGIFAILSGAYFVSNFGVAFCNVHTFSIRQAVAADALRGRINASYRFVSWGVIPIGAYASGQLASAIGIQPMLLVAALGVMLAQFWVFLPPIPSLRELPPPMDDDLPANIALQPAQM